MTRVRSEELRFAVRLTPRATVDRIDGVVDGVLRARVSAPPVDAAANRALVRLLARELGVPPSGVRLISGERARTKLIGVEAERDHVLAAWPGLRV